MTLTKKVIVLEETWLVNCVSRECVIFYSGGPFDVVNATFDRCEWKFQGGGATDLLPDVDDRAYSAPADGRSSTVAQRICLLGVCRA